MQKIENFTPRRRLNMSGSSTDSMDVEFAAGKFFFFKKIKKGHFVGKRVFFLSKIRIFSNSNFEGKITICCKT